MFSTCNVICAAGVSLTRGNESISKMGMASIKDLHRLPVPPLELDYFLASTMSAMLSFAVSRLGADRARNCILSFQ